MTFENHETLDIDLDEAREHVIGLMHTARGPIIAAFELGSHISITKGSRDFSTATDLAIDRLLCKGLLDKFPGTVALSEETAPEDGNYDMYQRSEALWIIDPIDGTTNFERGDPNFGLSVGLVLRGRTALGVLYFPATDDTLWAQQDRPGAFKDSQPLEVSVVDSFNKAVILADVGHFAETHAEHFRWMAALSPRVRQTKFLGSAVAAIAGVAEGKAEAYIHAGLKPWDVAAAVCIAEKAGAMASQVDGRPWDIFTPELLLTNGHLHSSIIHELERRPA